MENKSVSRRQFLSNLAIGSSAAFLAASPWLDVFGNNENISKSANNKIQIAFIGTGSRGCLLLEYFLNIATEINADVVAICDNYQPSIDAALTILKKKNINSRTYDNYKQLIEKEKLDGVIIATPFTQHAHITIDCLNVGIHVFCEKALARNLEDVKSMYDAYKHTGKILQTGHQRMFNPIYIEGMKRIHRGDLGEIGQIRAYWHRNNNWRRPVPKNSPELERIINWRLYKETSAGLLSELMSHQIGVASWALQQNPISVMGTGSTVFWKDGRTVPDNIALIFSYPNGVQFIYDSMISNKKYGLEEQILGSKGTIEFETNRFYAETPPPAPGIRQLVHDIEKGIFENIETAGSSWVPETAVKYEGERIQPNDSYNDSTLQLEAFVAFIRKGSIPETMVKEAYYGSMWTLLAEKAIDTSTIVTMPNQYII